MTTSDTRDSILPGEISSTSRESSWSASHVEPVSMSRFVVRGTPFSTRPQVGWWARQCPFMVLAHSGVASTSEVLGHKPKMYCVVPVVNAWCIRWRSDDFARAHFHVYPMEAIARTSTSQGKACFTRSRGFMDEGSGCA